MNGSKISDIPDWSGTHIRLRAELIVSTALFAVLAWWGIDLNRIPLLNIDLAKGSQIPRNLMLFGLFALSIYFALALHFRTRAENHRAVEPERYLSADVANIERAVSAERLNFDDIHSTIRTAAEQIESIFKAPEVALNSRYDEYKKIKAKLENETLYNELQFGMQRIFVDGLTAYNQKLDATHMAINSIKRIVKDAELTIDTSIDRYSTTFEGIQKRMRDELASYRAEVRSVRTDLGIDRNILGYVVPSTFAGLLFVTGVVGWFIGPT
ncbi:MAG: hypothetical protein IBJ07_09860 [Rhizobiaceae bacterium]|nr:hypothetical protein [Rhizobiaceae bacterium]